MFLHPSVPRFPNGQRRSTLLGHDAAEPQPEHTPSIDERLRGQVPYRSRSETGGTCLEQLWPVSGHPACNRAPGHMSQTTQSTAWISAASTMNCVN